MERNIKEIVKNIYIAPETVLIQEKNFRKNNPKYKYFVERIDKELLRRHNDENIKNIYTPIPDVPFNPALVYIIECQGFFKIGIAEEINSRMVSLQIGNPFKLKLEKCALFDNALAVEKHLHLKFKKKNTIGEWFSLTSNDLFYIDKIYESPVLITT